MSRLEDMFMHDQRVVMAVASYDSTTTAKYECEAVSQMSRGRNVAHVAAVVLEKDAVGELGIDLHENTAEGLPWGDTLLGGPLTVIATPVGIRFLVSMKTNALAWAGVGAIAGHFWYDIPREQLRQMSDLLEAGQASLAVVAVECDRDVLSARLERASAKIITDSIWADLETEFAMAVEEARLYG
jgi:uncharacterized membrane protein